MFQKMRKLGKTIDEVTVGEVHRAEKTIEDKELLLYLGLSDDANPVYIQHDYTARTPYKKPIVPHLMLTGIVSSEISAHLPGPGSAVLSHSLEFPNPLYHYASVDVILRVEEVNKEGEFIVLSVYGSDDDGRTVLEGSLRVRPAYPWKPVTKDAENFENF
ncbi:MaoC/PaaZ C-terminal domain-containing protein [Salisediminibacterium halotolerans]|uniref:Acyl dehydratase n=1 Tax=Salisediminibacterium halotolerans TaxID=517425 RepID=A0A1H9V4Q8_9BACI|nr:MaoC/PaaZ C-terminal domain-containing protein [Salisediminibacterium haloalkalitolerans]SES16706.1 Acyl dehydratase [Salisediminibacterium haloalkalitolerans]